MGAREGKEEVAVFPPPSLPGAPAAGAAAAAAAAVCTCVCVRAACVRV